MATKEQLQQIVARLKQSNPNKIILFGSHATGEAGLDSDIDLLVVTEDEFLPCSFAEKSAIYLKVASTITDISKRVPIDLIVHTKSMHEKFVEMGSVFSRAIALNGTVLYEKTH